MSPSPEQGLGGRVGFYLDLGKICDSFGVQVNGLDIPVNQTIPCSTSALICIWETTASLSPSPPRCSTPCWTIPADIPFPTQGSPIPTEYSERSG